ncbi:MAG: ribosome small subunit-dependent GTPase A [Solobacterium sp.]|nr:ribosome small subunit-dependent GTPase A [Solobacterium sp.]
MQARIIRIISKNYTVQLENGEKVDAILMGKVRLQTSPVAGDVVELKFTNNQYTIEKICPRTNHLVRPPVANVDQALIVMSVKDPDFSTTLIDRLSFLIMHANIKPVLVVTKTDLGIIPEVQKAIEDYQRGPMEVLLNTKEFLDPSLAKILENKISVLTGQSGAGKSTLLNSLDPSFHLETQEISKALGRGKHTTRHNELHEVANGLVADTPGFSSIDFADIDEDELDECVIDFVPFLHQCKFNDCKHHKEPGCKIKEEVEKGNIPEIRYKNYLAVLEMIQQRKEKYV